MTPTRRHAGIATMARSRLPLASRPPSASATTRSGTVTPELYRRDLFRALAQRARDRLALALAERGRPKDLDVGEIAVEDTGEPVSLRRGAADRDQRLVDLDRVLNEVRLETVHAEADGPRAVPEIRRPLELVVADVGELAEDAAMDLEEGVADLEDPAGDRLARPVAMLGSPGLVALPRLGLAGRSVGRARVLHYAEEAVLGAEHVLDDRTHRPLALRGRTVEIAVTHPRDGAGQVAIRPVVLAEDALGMRDGWAVRGAQRREPDREVPELVLCEEQGETKAFVVVFAPDPLAAHRRVGEVDRRAHELLDRLRDRQALRGLRPLRPPRRRWELSPLKPPNRQTATFATPPTVPRARVPTPAWGGPASFPTPSFPSRA